MTLAITVSDNAATNELVDLVGGFDNINDFNKSLIKRNKISKKDA